MWGLIAELLVILSYLCALPIMNISVFDPRFWFYLLFLILSFINGITTGRKR